MTQREKHPSWAGPSVQAGQLQQNPCGVLVFSLSKVSAAQWLYWGGLSSCSLISRAAGSLVLHFVLPLFRDFLSFSYRAEGRDTYLASQMKFQVLERVINILCIAWSCRRDNSVPNNITILPFFFFFFLIFYGDKRACFSLRGFVLFCFFFFPQHPTSCTGGSGKLLPRFHSLQPSLVNSLQIPSSQAHGWPESLQCWW